MEEETLNEVCFGGRPLKTRYNQKIIDLLIERQGLKRALKYLDYDSSRGEHYLGRLFDVLKNKSEPLKVLEVGCSAGHITEYLNRQISIEEIYSYDVDSKMVKICSEKVEFLNLTKVKDVKHLTSSEAKNLPYERESFDLVLVVAVVEHLPFVDRHLYVDEYYRVLKPGGLVAFMDTPNRHFPLEWHSTGLFFISKMSPELAYIYARLFLGNKYKNISFLEFVKPGVGWKNSSYYELLPRISQHEIKDVSSQYGYVRNNFILRFLSWLLRCPQSFFDWNLNIVFQKLS